MEKTMGEKNLEFNVMAKEIIKFLNDNYHPHTKVIITTNSAEIVDGVCGFRTEEFIKD